MRPIQRILLPALCTALLLPAVQTSVHGAADVKFRPTVTLGLEHNGNVSVVGEEGEAEQSDQITRLRLDLVLEATTPRTTFEGAYRPYREAYSDFDFLDNTGHAVTADLQHTISRRSTVEFHVDGVRTESQIFRAESVDQSNTLLPRTTIDRVTFDISGRVGGGSRSFWTWGAAAGISRYDDIAGATPEEDIDFQDSEDVGVSVGWEREISERSTLGLALRANTVSFEDAERAADVDVYGIYLVTNKEFGRQLSGSLSLGAMKVESADSDTTELGLEARLDREVTRTSTLSVGARQAVSQGIGTGGATLDRGGYLAWRWSRESKFGATVSVSHWDREALDLGPADLFGESSQTTSSLESFDWYVTRKLTVGVTHRYTKQDVTGVSDPEFGDLNTDYHSGGVVLRWAFNPR